MRETSSEDTNARYILGAGYIYILYGEHIIIVKLFWQFSLQLTLVIALKVFVLIQFLKLKFNIIITDIDQHESTVYVIQISVLNVSDQAKLIVSTCCFFVFLQPRLEKKAWRADWKFAN